MSFQPVVPFTGYSGWRFLAKTADAQQAAFVKSAPVMRTTEYFQNNIGAIKSVAELVNDRRLMTVVLGAFGLSEDINNKFFIQKVLSEGTIRQDSLANRLADTRYADMSAALGFDKQPSNIQSSPSLIADLVDRFNRQEFEKSVGRNDNNLRLALNLERALNDIVDRSSNNGSQWFLMMGNAPLRKVFEGAFGLPAGVGSIDIDKQRSIFQDRSQAALGTRNFSDFLNTDLREKIIRDFLIRSDAVQSSSASSLSNALTLLSSIRR